MGIIALRLLLLSAATPAAASVDCVVNLSVVLLLAIAADAVAANVGNLLFRRAVRLLHRVGAAFINLCVVLLLTIANTMVLQLGCAAWRLYRLDRLVAGNLQVAPIVTWSTATRLDAAAASADRKHPVVDAYSRLRLRLRMWLRLLPFSETLPPFENADKCRSNHDTHDYNQCSNHSSGHPLLFVAVAFSFVF